MLTLEDCKKYIKTSSSDEEILQIRDSLYQLADIYLESYLKGTQRGYSYAKCINKSDKLAQTIDNYLNNGGEMIMEKPPTAIYEYVCCGGGSDENGITWNRTGRYKSTEEDSMKNDDIFCKWYPSISEAAIRKGYGFDIPPKNKMVRGGWEEYQKLLKISEPYVVVIDGKEFIKRRYKK